MTKFERRAAALGVLAMACAPVTASAQVLFSDDFDAVESTIRYTAYAQDNDTGGPTEATGPLAEEGPITDRPYPVILPGGYDVNIDFNFNYGGFTHFYTDASNLPASRLIPQAPRSAVGSTTTVGLKVEVNNATPTGTAVLSLYPKLAEYAGGVLPSGNTKLTFDMWMNYNGPFNGGPGSTEFFTAGIQQQGGGIGGGIAAGDPGLNGMALAIDGEGGNVTLDYRYYTKNTRVGGPFALDQEAGYVARDEGVGQPGPGSAFNADHEAIFPFSNPTDANDVWYETPGAPGKHWTTFEIIHEDGVVYYYAQPAGAPTKSLLAARTDEHTSSGHAMLGYADFNSGVAGLDAGADHSFAVFDNIVLETVTQNRPKWNVNSNGNWSDPGNWANGVPNDKTHIADFTDGISGSGKTVNVDADHTIRAMTIDNAQPYTFAAGGGKIIFNSLTSGILGTLKVKSGSHTINAPVDTYRILWTDIAAGSTLTMNGAITELIDPVNDNAARYLKKTGAGTLVLGAANNWRGDTRVEAGTLSLAANNAIPTNGFATSVSSGATLNMNGFNFSTGALAVNGGTVNGGGGTITLDRHVFSTGGGTLAANVHFAPTSGFTGHRELISSTAPLTISGNISGAPKLHQYSTGANPTIVLSGTSTYTGATAVRGGTLVVASDAPSGAAGALGNSTTPVEVGDSTVTPLTAVRVASTGSVGGTFNAAANTITFGTALNTVDGVTLADGDRILLKNQVDPATGLQNGAPQNGIWVRTSGTVWTRAEDLNETAELQYGTQVAVTAGTTNAGRKYYLFEGSEMNTSLQVWGQEIANAALLTGGPITIGRDVNVLNTVNSGTSTVGGNTAHSSSFTGTITLNRATTLTAAAGGTVNFTGNINSNGNNITKGGAGKVVVKNVRAGDLNVSAGTLAMSPDSGAVGTSKIGGLTIATDAKLDLGANKLITSKALGTFDGTSYSGIHGDIARAYNFGTWDGPGGLMTSQELANPTSGPLGGTTTVAVNKASEVLFIGDADTAVFAGQTVTGSSTIAMYTYAGDVNLDGLVDAADYGVIDNWIQFPGTDGYANGDFNYDGIIDAADYGIIDNSIQLQGAPFPGVNDAFASAAIEGVTPVPEPASLGIMGIGAAALLGRRRRRLNGR